MPTFALGPAGALVPFRAPGPDYAAARARLGGTHETLAGRLIRDTVGFRRSFTLHLPPDLTAEQYSVLESLFEQPGPYRFVDPTRRNLLTANQSSGTDALRTTEGFSAVGQGTVTSDTAQFRSGTRSLKWDTVTSLTATGRGVYLPASSGTPDATWAAVLPSTVYTASAYLRASATVSMAMTCDWRDVAGAFISNSPGSAANPSTANFGSRFTVTATSPSTAAYAVPAALNQATTGAAVQVWADEWMLEQAAAASTWTFGTGVPLVSIDSLEPDFSNFALDANPPLLGATLVLLEI